MKRLDAIFRSGGKMERPDAIFTIGVAVAMTIGIVLELIFMAPAEGISPDFVRVLDVLPKVFIGVVLLGAAFWFYLIYHRTKEKDKSKE